MRGRKKDDNRGYSYSNKIGLKPISTEVRIILYHKTGNPTIFLAKVRVNEEVNDKVVMKYYYIHCSGRKLKPKVIIDWELI